METVIIRTGMGNILSVDFALRRLGENPVITDDAGRIREAGRVIFPGVGDAGSAMAALRKKGLDRVIPELTCPVLGICLGMQLMCSYSEESGTRCLGIFDQPVLRFKPIRKVPHVGWNMVTPLKGELWGEGEGYYYFVHSYFTPPGEYTAMVCDYIQPFTAGMEKNNFYALQFHPEKSGRRGETLLKRFLDLPGGEND